MSTELINAYSSRNLGDAAIMKALAFLSGDKLVTARLFDNVTLNVPGVMFCAEESKNSVCYHKPADRRISVGGDIFNNARPYFLTRNFLANLDKLRIAPQNTILFGQTIPASCKGLALWMLARTLKNIASVVVRDKKSQQLLEGYGVDAQLSYDVAFALSSSSDGLKKARKIYEKAGLTPEKTALLSVRSFDQMYPHDQDEFENKMVDTADMLAEKGYQVAVLIQSDASSHDSDRAVAIRLQDQSDHIAILDVISACKTDEDPVETLIGILEMAGIVVALRYHAAILRLVSGRMPYHISYSRKGDDLTERLKLPGCNLSDFEPSEAMGDILQTAKSKFDHESIREQVKTSFHSAIHKIRLSEAQREAGMMQAETIETVFRN